MTAPVDAVELRRAVWRQEYGYLSRDRARDEWLEEEYDRALQEYEGLRADLALVGAGADAFALRAEHDAAARRARRALDAWQLRGALEHLLRCRELAARMRELLDADAALRHARAAVERLCAEVRAPRLRALPCVDAPVRLLAAARERMREGCCTRAAYLARASAAQAAALAPEEPPAGTADRADPVRAAFGQMRALCARTAGLLDDPAADVGGDGTLAAAEALVDAGLVTLARRVAEELGALLAARERFHTALLQEGDDAGATVARLRGRLADTPDAERWDAAARMLWQDRLEDGLRRIRRAQGQPEPAAGDEGSAEAATGAGFIIIPRNRS